MRRPRTSVRLWQTELFIIVIVVAILILSASLTQGVQRTLKQLAQGTQLRNASALAQQLSPEFPLSPRSIERLRVTVDEYRAIYGDNVWVYDSAGTLLDSAYDGGPPAEVLDAARSQGLEDPPPYVSADLSEGGYVVAGRAILDPRGEKAGAVVLASPASASLAVLEAVRERLWVTFWVALTVAGALGFAFSEFIGRRVRAMTKAAAAIAGGDFEQRLPTGLVPDEIYELAESYNAMAVRLGEAFSAIQEREQEITAVVESMAEGVVAFDSAGTVRVVNPEALVLLGESDAEALLGLPADAITADGAILEAVAAGLSGDGVSATTEMGERSVMLHSTPLHGVSGEVRGAVLLLFDVTEQRRSEAAQRSFVANASHEIRTPIAALKGLLELLEDGAKEDPEVRDDFIRTMQLEVDRLGRLAGDLLILAQLEAGSLQLNREPQSANAMVESVQGVMRALAERAGVELVVDTPEADLQVLADRDRIMQVLIGFVDNALKHSTPGDSVKLRAADSQHGVTFSVADHGPGIPADAVPRIFDRFYRGEGQRAGARGAGLGLAIAKEIVEAHGSSVDVRETPGGGATFAFTLPAER